MIEQPKNTENWLLGLPIYIVMVFWLFLDKGIEKRWEVNVFMDFGLLGLMTLKKEIEQLYKNNLILVSILSLTKISSIKIADIDERRFMVRIVAVAGIVAVCFAVAGVVAVAFAGVVAMAGKFAGSVAVDSENRIEVVFVIGIVVVFVIGILALVVPWTGSLALALAAFLSGLGLGLWERGKEKQDWLKYLAILAFPWFCTFPIVFIFSTLAMQDFLSWQWPQILITWSIIFGMCTYLWQRGQKLDHDARNPLYGILDKQGATFS